MKKIAFLLLCVSWMGTPTLADKVLDFDERSDFDLPGDPSAPTQFTVDAPGQYVIYGNATNSAEDDTFAPGGEAGDYDVFTFNLSQGIRIDSIDFSHIIGSGELFLGFEQGTSLSVNTATNLSDFSPFASGSAVLSRDNLFDELLPGLIDGSLTPSGGSIGTPITQIESGSFTFAIQSLDTEFTPYGITFNAVVVPEPTTFGLLLIALGGCLTNRRRI